jgi:hypothetical protein
MRQTAADNQVLWFSLIFFKSKLKKKKEDIHEQLGNVTIPNKNSGSAKNSDISFAK